MVLLAALIVAAAVIAAAYQIVTAVQSPRPDVARGRALELLVLFAPATAAAAADPSAILIWQPLARMARQMFPEEFAELDSAAGGAFPFSQDRLQSAHAQWTADWLGWER